MIYLFININQLQSNKSVVKSFQNYILGIIGSWYKIIRWLMNASDLYQLPIKHMPWYTTITTAECVLQTYIIHLQIIININQYSSIYISISPSIIINSYPTKVNQLKSTRIWFATAVGFQRNMRHVSSAGVPSVGIHAASHLQDSHNGYGSSCHFLCQRSCNQQLTFTWFVWQMYL